MPEKSYMDLVNETRSRVREVTPADVRAMLEHAEPVVLIDVREDREWNLGHMPRAVHIARGVLEQKVERAATRGSKVVLYCAGGNRSVLAADSLRQMGFTDVASMSGGFRSWVEAGGEVEG